MAVDLLAERPDRARAGAARAPAARREPRAGGRLDLAGRRARERGALRDRLGPRARQRPGVGEPRDRRARSRSARCSSPAFVVWELRAARRCCRCGSSARAASRSRTPPRSSCSSGCSARSSCWRSSSRRCRATRRSAAGLRILPWTLAPMFIAPVAGALSDRISPRLIIGTGLTLQAVALAWIGLVSTPTSPYSSLIAPFVVAGVGMALFFAPVANVVLSAVRPQEEGQASGANNTIRELGGVFGVAVLAAVFSHVGGYEPRQAFTDGMNAAVLVGAGVVGVGAVAAFAMPGVAVARSRFGSRRRSRSRTRPRPAAPGSRTETAPRSEASSPSPRGNAARRQAGLRRERRPALVPPALAAVEHRAELAPERPDRRDLLLGVAAVADALVELLLVLEAPPPPDREPEVELEVLRVVADRRPPERLLEVQVPAGEAPLGAVPEVPDRVRLSRTTEHEHAVAGPAAASRPRDAAGRPRSAGRRTAPPRACTWRASAGASSTTTTGDACHGVPRQTSRWTIDLALLPAHRRQASASARCTLRLPMSETQARGTAVPERDAGGAPELSVVVTLFQEAATLEELHAAARRRRSRRSAGRTRCSTSTTARPTGRSRRSSGSTRATRTCGRCA